MAATLSHPDYPAFLTTLKSRILAARTLAARAVNHELVLLYWDIGRGIVEKQQAAGWGDAVVERLAADLQAEFPDMRGFSVGNIWRMRQFYQLHMQPEFLAQAARELKVPVHGGKKLSQPVGESGPSSTDEPAILAQLARELLGQIPWWHHVELIAKVKDPAAHYYYLRATARLGWSRSVLLNQIKAGTYERAVKAKKTHNFALALPEHFAEQANEMLKSSYNLEFLGLSRAMKERELEDRLISRLQSFILELG
jgi:predicted nuclease of restriction endonuclease-like (RecB) superfamily